MKGQHHLDASKPMFAYSVGFTSLGPPFHEEVIVILWRDVPEMNDAELHAAAVLALRKMVERAS